MKFESIEKLNLFINEYDNVDFVDESNENEFLDLVNEELKNYKRKTPLSVVSCLIRLENKGLLDKFC
jgi:hypothetical protein